MLAVAHSDSFCWVCICSSRDNGRTSLSRSSAHCSNRHPIAYKGGGQCKAVIPCCASLLLTALSDTVAGEALRVAASSVGDRVVVDERKDVDILEGTVHVLVNLGDAVEEWDANDRRELDHLRADLRNELKTAERSAAGGDEVVKEDDASTLRDGVLADGHGVGLGLGVLLVVGRRLVQKAGGLRGLAHHHERNLKREGEGSAEEEAAGIEAKDVRGALLSRHGRVAGGHNVDDLLKEDRVLTEGRDVVEARDVLGAELRRKPCEGSADLLRNLGLGIEDVVVRGDLDGAGDDEGGGHGWAGM